MILKSLATIYDRSISPIRCTKPQRTEIILCRMRCIRITWICLCLETGLTKARPIFLAPNTEVPAYVYIQYTFRVLNYIPTKFTKIIDIFYAGFPFDLPVPFAESNPNVNATTRDGNLPGSETSVHKSLPDFLSDGPIYNRSADPEPTGASMAESTERRVRMFLAEGSNRDKRLYGKK